MRTGKEIYSNLPIKDQIHLLGEQLRPYPWKIAIDGPAAAGKGTLLAGLIDEPKLEQCPTGDMYRAVTIYLTEILRLDPPTLDDTKLASCLTDFSITFTTDAEDKKHVIIRSPSRDIAED